MGRITVQPMRFGNVIFLDTPSFNGDILAEAASWLTQVVFNVHRVCNEGRPAPLRTDASCPSGPLWLIFFRISYPCTYQIALFQSRLCRLLATLLCALPCMLCKRLRSHMPLALWVLQGRGKAPSAPFYINDAACLISYSVHRIRDWWSP